MNYHIDDNRCSEDARVSPINMGQHDVSTQDPQRD